MNNFNDVFLAIKKLCEGNTTYHIDNYEEIANHAKVPLQSVKFYLDCLSDIGLIEYSGNKKNISLTEQGRVRNRLFIT